MRRAPTEEKGNKTKVFENTLRSARERGIIQVFLQKKNSSYVMSKQVVCVSNVYDDLICKVCTIEFLGQIDKC